MIISTKQFRKTMTRYEY